MQVEFNISIDDFPQIGIFGSTLIPINLIRDALEYRVIDDKFWYWGEKFSSLYIDLSTRDGSYTVHKSSKQLLEAEMPNIMDLVFRHFSSHTMVDKRHVDFVSLGIGNMEKEASALEKFIERYRMVNGSRLGFKFVPIDVSFYFLTYAMRYVLGHSFGSSVFKDVTVMPIMADFTKKLPSYFDGGGDKFITAFGVVHTTFPWILDSFKDMMTDRSLLLIDVEMVGGRSDSEICKSYHDKDAVNFFYQTVNLLGQGAKYPMEIQSWEGTPLGNVKEFGGYNLENGIVEPRIVTKDTVNDFVKDLGLPEKTLERINVAREEGSKTIVMVYTPKESGKLPLLVGSTKRYEQGPFEAVLENSGFEIVGSFLNESKVNAYYLLRLGRGSSKGPDPPLA